MYIVMIDKSVSLEGELEVLKSFGKSWKEEEMEEEEEKVYPRALSTIPK